MPGRAPPGGRRRRRRRALDRSGGGRGRGGESPPLAGGARVLSDASASRADGAFGRLPYLPDGRERGGAAGRRGGSTPRDTDPRDGGGSPAAVRGVDDRGDAAAAVSRGLLRPPHPARAVELPERRAVGLVRGTAGPGGLPARRVGDGAPVAGGAGPEGGAQPRPVRVA